MTPEEFAAYVTEGITQPEDFRPIISYNADGDIIEAIWEPGTFVGKWLMPGLTLYLERDTNRVIGFVVEGVEDVMNRTGSIPAACQ